MELTEVQPGWYSKTMSQKKSGGEDGVRLSCSSVIERLPNMLKALENTDAYRMFSIVFGDMSMLKF